MYDDGDMKVRQEVTKIALRVLLVIVVQVLPWRTNRLNLSICSTQTLLSLGIDGMRRYVTIVRGVESRPESCVSCIISAIV